MNSVPRISYISQFVIFWGLLAAAFLFSSSLGVILWVAMTGGDLDSIKNGTMTAENADAVKIVQLVASTAMFLIPALVFARIVNNRPLRHLGLRTGFSWIQLGLGAIIIFIAFYLSGSLAELTNQIPIPEKWEKLFTKLEKQYMDQVMVMANMESFGDYLFTMLVIAIAPAIFEELLFRGAFQQLLSKWTRLPWLAITITSILFSAVHFSYYGFLSRVALGLILGLLFHYSKSLWLPIIAHFINNGVAVTMMYIMKMQGKLTPEVLDEKFPIWWGVIAAAIIGCLFILLRNESKKNGSYYIDNTEVKSNNPFLPTAVNDPGHP
ncbi:MAG TPA: CPBP family intramembrane glutamic endopeptidase [Chitinophagaceae bacterium]